MRDKAQFKRVQHLYLTSSSHIGRNWTECWMKIITVWKGYPTFMSDIFLLYRPFIFLFSKWRPTKVQLWWFKRACRFRWWKTSSRANKKMDREVERNKLLLKQLKTERLKNEWASKICFPWVSLTMSFY